MRHRYLLPLKISHTLLILRARALKKNKPLNISRLVIKLQELATLEVWVGAVPPRWGRIFAWLGLAGKQELFC